MVYSNFYNQGNPQDADGFTSDSSSYDQEYSTSGSTISRARYEVSVSEILFFEDNPASGSEVTSVWYGGNYDSVLDIPSGTTYTRDATASTGYLPTSICSGNGAYSPDNLYIAKIGASHRAYFFSSYDTNSLNQAGMFCYNGPFCSPPTTFGHCTSPGSLYHNGYVEIFVR